MKTSTDMSIFLWQGPAVDAFGMLASDPSYFSDIPDNVRSLAGNCTNLFSMSEGWSLNNAGISIVANIYPYLLTDEFGCIFALHLHEPHTFSSLPGLAIFVKEYDTQPGVPSFARVMIDRVLGHHPLQKDPKYICLSVTMSRNSESFANPLKISVLQLLGLATLL